MSIRSSLNTPAPPGPLVTIRLGFGGLPGIRPRGQAPSSKAAPLLQSRCRDVRQVRQPRGTRV